MSSGHGSFERYGHHETSQLNEYMQVMLGLSSVIVLIAFILHRDYNKLNFALLAKIADKQEALNDVCDFSLFNTIIDSAAIGSLRTRNTNTSRCS